MFSVKIEYQPNQIINGLIFLRETRIHTTPNGKNFRKAIFKCDCGNEFETTINSVKAGGTRSCGCLIKTRNIQTRTTHGLYKHPLYIVWKNMRQRCYNPKYDRYSDWGGRGIKICDEWKNNFKVFYDWAMTNGYQKGLQIDRINNDGNYEPSNCQFVTPLINNKNQRSTKLNLDLANEIRNRKVLNPNVTLRELSNTYNINTTSISRIINNKIWVAA